MTIIKRLTNLLTADMHAVLDLIEDPVVILKQAIRDMEASIEEQHKSECILKANLNILLMEEQQLNKQTESINLDLEHSFKTNNSKLAKKLIKRKLLLKKYNEIIQQNIHSLNETISHLHKQLIEKNSQCESIKQESFQLFQQNNNGENTTTKLRQGTVTTNSLLTPSITREEVELAYLTEQHAREQYVREQS